MPVPGPWTQGPDVPVLTAIDRFIALTWRRTVVLDPESVTYEDDKIAAWTAMMELPSGDFAAIGTEEVIDGTDPDALPVSSLQQTAGDDLVSELGYLRLVSTNEDPTPPELTDPMVEPDIPDGATIEWEDEDGGEFLPEFYFRVFVRAEGDLTDQGLQARYQFAAIGADRGDPDPGYFYPMLSNIRHWPFTTFGGPWHEVALSSTGGELEILGLLKSHVDGTVPDSDNVVYLERRDEDEFRPALVERHWRPPQYRIIYPGSGAPSLRQRQVAGGVLSGPPLRQRQNGGDTGGAPLRQRHTGR